MVTVDAAVFTLAKGKTKILLIQRRNEPYKGKWALPGGFVDMHEDLADAAARELREETHLTNIPLEQMHTFGTVGRDPRGRLITIVFFAIAPDPDAAIKAGDDAAEVKWFDIEKLPENMAFDHSEVVVFAIRKLKEKKIP